jgi:hypothetical protein
VGEILSEAECHRRMEEQSKAGISSFYFLSIDQDSIIDARLKASIIHFFL